MSDFDHIEITIETVAIDGTRTHMTRWTCPSVEMGATRDRRVQLRFAGEPVVVEGEPERWSETWLSLNDTSTSWTASAEPVKPLYDEALAAALLKFPRTVVEGPHRYSVSYTDESGERVTHSWTGGETEQREEATARDVATDPQVGDRVTLHANGSLEHVVTEVDGVGVCGRLRLPLEGDMGGFRIDREGWRAICRTPGAVIERAPE